MRTDIDDRELLAIESATIAVLTETGRGLHHFHSTSWADVSSQGVTERLGLRFIGTRFTIT